MNTTRNHAASKNKRNQAEQEDIAVIEESVQSTKKRRRINQSKRWSQTYLVRRHSEVMKLCYDHLGIEKEERNNDRLSEMK
jgi:hypothetical protein